MSSINLLPTNEKKLNGQRGEQLDTALLDMATAHLLNLHLAIDNGTDSNCVMAWIRGYVDADVGIPPTEVREVITKIFKEVSSIHATMVAARREIK